MTSFRVLAIVVAFVMTAGIAWAQSSHVPESKPKDKSQETPFTITIGTQQSAAKVGSKILVKVTFKNTPSHDIIIPVMEEVPTDLRIDVRDSQGNKVPLMKP